MPATFATVGVEKTTLGSPFWVSFSIPLTICLAQMKSLNSNTGTLEVNSGRLGLSGSSVNSLGGELEDL